MAQIRPATKETLAYIEAAMTLLYSARREMRLAGAPRTVAKIESALKSAGGARRHAERRLARTLPPHTD